MKRSICLVIGTGLLFALAAGAQTTQLSKRVYKINGAAVNTNPAVVANGTLLDFVLTYQYNPTPAPPAKAEIRDLLSSSLQYQIGSLNVPAGWSGQWFNGAWVASEPANATGVGALTAPNPVPFGAGQTAWIPAPPAAPVNTSLGGDGYEAIPASDGNVYVVNHHTNGTYLDCFNIATGVQCTGYPAHVANTAGAGFNTTANDNGTPGKPYAYLDSANRLYFPVEKINNANPHEIGLLCADLTAKQSCGFHRLVFYTGLSTITPPVFHTTDMRSFQGIGAVGSKVYVQLPNAKIGCLDTAPITPVPCSGQPYATTATTSNEYASSSEIVGSRIYSIRQSTPYVLDCFDTNTNAICAGSWPRFPDPTGAVGILYPLLNTTGTVTGMCALTTNPPTSSPPPAVPPPMVFQCYDRLTGAVVPFPASYAAWAKQYSGGYYQAAGYGQSGHYLARVFNGNRVPATIGCYDFATAAQCAGWTAPVGDLRHYKVTADPQRLGCMWYYGDQRKLGSFDAFDGGSCGRRVSVGTTITPSEAYCATSGDISAWGQLFLNGLTIGGGITATLSIYDGINPSNPAQNTSGNPYAQNLNVTSFPVTLGPGGLGIPYGGGPGAYTSLHIVLTFNGITSNSAWMQTPPPSIEVTWKGGPPEICFQAKVIGCENPTITNQATAVTTPLGGGTPITATAPATPLTMTHQFGAECPAKLTITKAVPGAPPGFTGTFLFNVTCSTPNGGIVQQQLSIQWPNTSVSLPNVPAGSQCTAFEVPPLPTLPSGYSWDGPPIAVPGNVIQITAGGPNQISFTNRVRRCNDLGTIKINKQVFGAPAGFSGTFTFNVSCWAGTTLITQQAQINYPSQSSVTVANIPTGATCNAVETATAPLPSGWFWQVSYAPASGQVSLIGKCCSELTVINRAKFCCDETATIPDDAKQ